jgi:hypothetical protein
MKDNKGDDLTPNEGGAETEPAGENQSQNIEPPEKVKNEDKKEEKLTHAE